MHFWYNSSFWIFIVKISFCLFICELGKNYEFKWFLSLRYFAIFVDLRIFLVNLLANLVNFYVAVHDAKMLKNETFWDNFDTPFFDITKKIENSELFKLSVLMFCSALPLCGLKSNFEKDAVFVHFEHFRILPRTIILTKALLHHWHRIFVSV